MSDAAAGEALAGKVSLQLPSGTYDVRLYSPVTGEYSPAIEMIGGKRSDLILPPFRQDLVIRATRR